MIQKFKKNLRFNTKRLMNDFNAVLFTLQGTLHNIIQKNGEEGSCGKPSICKNHNVCKTQ